MIDKHIRDKIEVKAFEIYEYREANNITGSALGDWLDAQAQIITDRRANNNCPKCGFGLLARNNNEIVCLNSKCDFKIEAKRKFDEDIPDVNEIRKIWE